MYAAVAHLFSPSIRCHCSGSSSTPTKSVALSLVAGCGPRPSANASSSARAPRIRPGRPIVSFDAARLGIDPVLLVALPRELLLHGPRPRPHRRILDGHHIFERVGPVRVQRSTRCRFSREPWKSVLGLKFVTSTTSVSPSQWPRESPIPLADVGRQMRAAVHHDVALPALALADVVEHRDAAGRLHDAAEAAGRGAELGQPEGQAAVRQRAVLRTVMAVHARRVVARRKLGESRRGRRIVLAAGAGRLLVLAGLGRLQQCETKFAIGGGGLLRPPASSPECGHWADRRSAMCARRCASAVMNDVVVGAGDVELGAALGAPVAAAAAPIAPYRVRRAGRR